MTAQEEQEMHALAKSLAVLTEGTGWEASRYWSIGKAMEKLVTYCAVCDLPADAKGAAMMQRFTWPSFPGHAYDEWKTTEPEPMPSAGDICTPAQDGEAYSLLVDLKDYGSKWGRQALRELMDEALS